MKRELRAIAEDPAILGRMARSMRQRSQMVAGALIQSAGVVLIAAGARMQGLTKTDEMPAEILAAFEKLGEHILESVEQEVTDARQRRMRDDTEIAASLSRQSEFYREREGQPWPATD